MQISVVIFNTETNSTTVTFTGSTLVKVSCSENILNSQMQVAPGICEQYADIKLYDPAGVLTTLAAHPDELYKYTVSIYADEELLGSYLLKEYDAESDSKMVMLTCNDYSSTFGKINLGAFEVKDRTLDELLQLCFAQAASYAWGYLDFATEQYCKSIWVPNSWLYNGTLLEMLNKVCNAGMLRIYWKQDGFVIARCW